MDEEYIDCFSCGAKSLNLEGECHEYMLASPGCYEMFNEVLNREYSDFRYSKAHHYTVDSYAVQHPGKVSNQKAVNSVGIHLVSLYFLFEKKYDITNSAKVKMEFAQFNKINKIIQPIERPEKFKGLTVFEIWDNENPNEHFELCEQWAENSWESWSNHHETIEKWADLFMKN
jgi:hypothetical protein